MKSLTVFALIVLASPSALVGCGSDSGTTSARSYVLVHGAWMGAWCWNDVAAGLRSRGASVVTVELPAHGDDQTSLPEATLDAYVATVRAAVEAAPQPVTLVGHSMGGVVVTQVAESSGELISKLVYLGAYMPQDGQSLFDIASTDADSHLGLVLQVDQDNGVARIPHDDLADIFIADGTEAEIASVVSHYRDEPLLPFVTPVHTTASGWGAVPKAYIFTKADHALSYARQQTMTAGVAMTTTATLETSHAPFLSQPELVVSTLEVM